MLQELGVSTISRKIMDRTTTATKKRYTHLCAGAGDQPCGEVCAAGATEGDDAKSVRAVGDVLRRSEELERGRRDGGAVARKGADESAGEAGIGDENPLKRNPELPLRLPRAFHPRSRRRRQVAISRPSRVNRDTAPMTAGHLASQHTL